jgi:eukaryotic-like serine/threonine-protein kinase
MPNSSLECNRVDISLLLAEERTTSDVAIIAHLEECASCRRRLETQAASDDWWQDCKTHLGPTSHDHLSANPLRPTVERNEATLLNDDFSGVLAPPSHPELLGRIGRYEVEKVLGHGGMGVVFKAFDSELNRPVAIKVLAPHLAGSGAARQRFGREARAAAAVAHEHVVSIHDVEVSAVHPYLVMQYVPGESLQSYVDHHGPLDTCDLVRIALQIADGLSAAHSQGLVHRDIKPGNIMLENGLGRVVITDFGLARAADDASLTHSGIVAGTPHYMAPEQARGEQADAQTDLFSLGAVMYFMATGHPPFRAEQSMAVLHRICNDRQRPLQRINPNIPVELTAVIDRLLEKKPVRRFTSAEALQQVLKEILTGIQNPCLRRRWLQHIRQRSRLALVACGLAIAVFVGAWFFGQRPPLAASGNGAREFRSDQAIPAQPGGEEVSGDAAARGFDFVNELSAVNQSLGEVERRRFPEWQYGDSWRQDLSAALKETSRLEMSLPASSSSPKFPTGEIP